MSEKIIVLHPENQPEVDIYPIIKEGSIPNSVIDNQKIKSRTIINSNIALNTLKYEVLHQTLKDLIDSKITQANMENYLSSYYYNVEETQQYVGSEINTLHQTIQNEFYSNTTIDNMLMEKTDLSLFRQYLPGTFLDLDKQQDNQTSKLNIHANGSIFLTNSGNKTNSGNYYFPNSIVKTEDAPNGYYVLSTTNDDYQSLYNLGAYDKITTNDDGTYTITRQTGYHNISNDLIEHGYYRTTQGGHGEYGGDSGIHTLPIAIDNSGDKNFINNLLTITTYDGLWNGLIGISLSGNGKCWMNLGDNYTSKEQYVEYLSKNNIYIQYKLATATTEKVEANHYARYNERFILDHNKSEAERSCNLLENKNIQSYNLDFLENNTTYTLSFSLSESIGFTLADGTSTIVDRNLSSGYNSFTFVKKSGGNAFIWFSNASKVSNLMLNEGSVALPYQPYEGKVIHEKDIKNLSGVIGYGITQLYKHDYELEAQPSGDTINVTCWSTKPDKILLKDITRYAFSNVQAYNSTNDETIQVIKWDTTGFNYIGNNGTILGNGYTVAHYYINGEPTTY